MGSSARSPRACSQQIHIVQSDVRSSTSVELDLDRFTVFRVPHPPCPLPMSNTPQLCLYHGKASRSERIPRYTQMLKISKSSMLTEVTTHRSRCPVLVNSHLHTCHALPACRLRHCTALPSQSTVTAYLFMYASLLYVLCAHALRRRKSNLDLLDRQASVITFLTHTCQPPQSAPGPH